MKILLIWPNKDNFGFKPLGLALISAVLKQRGHDVELFDTTFIDFGYESDCEVQSKIKVFKPVNFTGYDVEKKKLDLGAELVRKLDNFNPDVVGVSALSDEILIGLEASRIVKRWNSSVPVLWGNKAATMAAHRVLSDDAVDYACIGEGVEFVWEFVECISARADPKTMANLAYRAADRSIVQNRPRPFFQDLDRLPYLDWSIFDRRQFLKPYDGAVYIGGDHMIGWGCPAHCTYCINHAYRKLYGSKPGRFLRWYTADRIINELKHLVEQWGITLFKFHDEDFCLRPMSYFTDLAQKYRNIVGVPFTAMTNAHTLTREKVDLLRQMNCLSISIGIETGNDAMRRDLLERKEKKSEIVQAIHMLNDAGIRTSGFNMLGIPFETRSSIMETIDLNRQSRVRYPNTSFFYPLEGTRLREIALKLGLIDEQAESVYDSSRPTLTLPGISADELIALRERFVLYVKMPREYHKYIERSEKGDTVGGWLTEELYRIYDECVFRNDGLWNDHGRSNEHLELLEKICSGRFVEYSHNPV